MRRQQLVGALVRIICEETSDVSRVFSSRRRRRRRCRHRQVFYVRTQKISDQRVVASVRGRKNTTDELAQTLTTMLDKSSVFATLHHEIGGEGLFIRRLHT